MNIPKTIYSDRNKIEMVNGFIVNQQYFYTGYPSTLAKQRLEHDVFNLYGIKIHLIDHKKANTKKEDDTCYMAYNICVANKKRGVLLEFLGNELYDTVLLKFKEKKSPHLDNDFEYERY
jgi:hypothetical protein